MYKSRLNNVLFIALLGTAGLSQAATVTNNFVPGTLQNSVTGINTAHTYGNMMDGMLVTAYFSNNTSETSTWADKYFNGGGTTALNWSLEILSGRTDTAGAWKLTNYSDASTITRITLDGKPGNTVFDTYNHNQAGTAKSLGGHNLSLYSRNTPHGINAAATFSDAVGVGGNAPVGDIYRRLEINFGGGHYGGLPGSSFYNPWLRFTIDTDNLNIQPVPVPAAAWLLLSGLTGLGFISRRKKTS